MYLALSVVRTMSGTEVKLVELVDKAKEQRRQRAITEVQNSFFLPAGALDFPLEG